MDFGGEIYADLGNQWTGFAVGDGESQTGGGQGGEADDTAVSDGGQSVTFFCQFVLEELPLTIHKGFQCERLHALSQGDVLLSDETVEGRGFLEVDCQACGGHSVVGRPVSVCLAVDGLRRAETRVVATDIGGRHFRFLRQVGFENLTHHL